MAQNKKPIELHLAGGNKSRLTKAEIENRKSTEIKAVTTVPDPPAWLLKKQKDEFTRIAKQLADLDIFSELDADSLAAYISERDAYIAAVRTLRRFKWSDEPGPRKDILAEKNSAYKNARSSASDLGLTITSRCKLVIPKAEEPKENKFSKFQSG